MLNPKAWERGSRRSCIRELFAYGRALAEKEGEEAVCDFSLGNPATPPPAAVLDALSTLTAGNDPMQLHGYTSAEGDAAARSAIADDLNRRFQVGVSARDLFLTAGAAPAVTAVCAALTATQDSEFLVPAPYFPEYGVFATVCGAHLRVIPPDEPNFQINFGMLDTCLSPSTQAIILNSPNNPTGVVYTRETLERLSDILTTRAREYGHPIYILCDEPYRELVYDGREVPYLPHIYPDTVICYSYSKSLSLPGDRIGYVLVPPAATDHDALCAAVAGAARGIGHVCAPSILQHAVALCAGARPDISTYDRNRRLLYDALTEYGYECVYPDGAFYLFVKAPGGDAQMFSDRARARGVLVVPGGDFGCPSYIRIAYCVAETVIRRALPHFKALICAN